MLLREIPTLQAALNVELQRANSRMSLERTAQLDNLIDIAMVKCELGVSKKKEDAIESLRLRKLKPARVHEEIMLGQSEEALRSQAVIRGPTVKECVASQNNELTKKTRKRSPKEGVKTSGLKQHMESNIILNPPPCSLKPRQEVSDENLGSQGVQRAVNLDREERMLTTKSSTSQLSSTSVSKTPCQGRSKFVRADSYQAGKQLRNAEEVHWEPPFERNLNQE